MYIDLLTHLVKVRSGYLGEESDKIIKIETWFFPLEDFLPYIRVLEEEGKTDVNQYGTLFIRQGYVLGNNLMGQSHVTRGVVVGEISLDNLVLNVDLVLNNGIETNSSSPLLTRSPSYN
jgi:hypothetical protein